MHDGRGSVGQQVTATGSVTFAAFYSPYGEPSVTLGASASVFFGYNAEEQNPVTGLQYLRARYYQPTTASFAQQDTYLGDVSNPATLNRFSYCVADPVNYRDPSGMTPIGFRLPPVSPKVLSEPKLIPGGRTLGELDAVSEMLRLAAAGDLDAAKTVVKNANSPWVDAQMYSQLGWVVQRVNCVDLSYIDYDPSQGLNETVGDLSWMNQPLVFRQTVTFIEEHFTYVGNVSNVTVDPGLCLNESCADMPSPDEYSVSAVGVMERMTAKTQILKLLTTPLAALCGPTSSACLATMLVTINTTIPILVNTSEGVPVKQSEIFTGIATGLLEAGIITTITTRLNQLTTPKPTTTSGTIEIGAVGEEISTALLTGTHKSLTQFTKGYSGAIQSHHLIEKRFVDQMENILGANTDDWMAVILTKEEHTMFTNAWRKAIPLDPGGTSDASIDMIVDAAKEIYKDYPELLRLVEESLGAR
jgi:RHS repeat-associated protein